VQVLVNPAGDVVSAALLQSCGRPDADAHALACARAAQFEAPSGADAAAGRPPDAPPVVGVLIFAWQTLPLPAADTPGANP